MIDGVAGVAVVHYGDIEPTLRCLESVVGEGSRIKRRVVVVDNSGNLTQEQLGSDVKLLTCADNPGFGAAINLGVDFLDHDRRCTVYLALNNDALLGAGFLDAAAHALEDVVGAAGGPIRSGGDGSDHWYAGGGLNLLTGTVWQDRSATAASQRREVGFIPGTALAIAPDAWRQIGGFDPRFFLYNEDVDICLRLRRAGWKLLFEPDMVCEHGLGGATGSAERSPLYLEHLSRTRLLPFKSRTYRCYLAVVHSLYNTVRVGALGVRHGRHSGPYIRALIRGHLEALSSVFG